MDLIDACFSSTGTSVALNIDGAVIDSSPIGATTPSTGAFSTLSASGALDLNGAVQLDATLTVGVNDTGYDVKFFGATAGAYMLWDESADDLILGGAGGLSVAGASTLTGVATLTGGFTASAASTITTADNLDTLSLISTDADAGAGPNLRLYRNSGSPADGDSIGKIQFEGRNDNSQDVVYAELFGETYDVSDGTEDGRFFIKTMVGGTSTDRMYMNFNETVFNEGSVDLDFRVESNGNANMLFVDGGANAVGIGTASPTQELHIATTEGATGDVTLVLDTGSGSSAGQDAVIQTYRGNADLLFLMGSSEKMRIDSSGDVGIGTASPSALLSLNKTYDNAAFVISDDSSAGDYVTFQIKGGQYNGGVNKIEAINTTSLAFATGGGTEAMRIDTSGNVGIGTASPNTKLHAATGSNGSGLVDVARFQNTGTTANDGARIQLTAGTSTSGAGIGCLGDALNSAHLVFHAGGNTERMRLDSSGRLLVGATSGNQRLHVTDNANDNTVCKIQNSGNSTPYGMAIEFNGAAPDDNTRYFLKCADTGADRMKIYSDGDVWTADAGTLTSDRSLKTDIADATSKLADINQLQVKNFKWIPEYHPNKQNKNIGFIADEFETVFPSLVTEHENPLKDEDGIVKSIRYGALIPILVKAIQELSAEVEQLKQQAHEKCDN